MPSIILRTPTLDDQGEFLALVRASRGLHDPWVDSPATPERYRAYLARMAQLDNAALLVCRQRSGEIVGVINITNMVLGAFRSGHLGYYVFAPFARQGFMRAGLSAAARLAFSRLHLRRLEANIQPDNVASIRLVQACGFAKEGYSPRYLKIGGQWRDHERWALLSP